MGRWEDEGYVNGHWGSRGSGVLFVAPGRRFLLLRRSQKIHKPGLWGLPGGAIPVDGLGRYQDAWTSARREVFEEAGHRVRHAPLLVLRSDTPDGFSFVTFVVLVPKEFPAKLSWEHDDWSWVTRQEAEKLPLHPGIEGLLDLEKIGRKNETSVYTKAKIQSLGYSSSEIDRALKALERTPSGRDAGPAGAIVGKPPKAVQRAAFKGLKIRASMPPSRRGGTDIGVGRAIQLALAQPLPERTIRRMRSFFSRHARDRRPYWDAPGDETKGYQAHLLWGGDPGRDFAEREYARLEES